MLVSRLLKVDFVVLNSCVAESRASSRVALQVEARFCSIAGLLLVIFILAARILISAS